MAGVDKIVDQAQTILKKKSIDGYEIYFSQSTHFDVESKEGRLKASRRLGTWGGVSNSKSSTNGFHIPPF